MAVEARLGDMRSNGGSEVVNSTHPASRILPLPPAISMAC
jgi:hypothetical protein